MSDIAKEQPMPLPLLTVLTLAAALGSGLIAGTFFAFSSFVMAALARVPTPQGIQAMQAINITVINPVFMVVFLGMVLLSVVLGIMAVVRWNEFGSFYLLAGGVLYLLGFAITVLVNVPMNGTLAAADPAAATSATLWADYLSRWTHWNSLRGFACLAAATAFTQSYSVMR
jgi:uncharacterized membrane protein